LVIFAKTLNKIERIKSVYINEATENDFEIIKTYIQKFELDNRDMQQQQFVVAKENDCLIGFGRIRKHNGCDEFCSLGVIESKRFNGVAKELIKARIKLATQPIYLVCIIPEFFETLGFSVVTEYPFEIQDKLDYCIGELVVEEKYVVMKYQKGTTE
jgi:N-acetylglutamate synthase-like GNAT family acetyltransferase